MRSRVVEPPILVGQLSRDPMARELALEAAHLTERYAREVVREFALCPHLRDIETGLGAVCVVVDRELDPAAVARAVRATGRTISHVVFPRAVAGWARFECFAIAVGDSLYVDGGLRLFPAAFHPEMIGGSQCPEQLAGLLRRSPDPLVQLIPVLQNNHNAGVLGPTSHRKQLHRRIRGDVLERVVERQAALRLERKQRYARFVDRFGPFAW